MFFFCPEPDLLRWMSVVHLTRGFAVEASSSGSAGALPRLSRTSRLWHAAAGRDAAVAGPAGREVRKHRRGRSWAPLNHQLEVLFCGHVAKPGFGPVKGVVPGFEVSFKPRRSSKTHHRVGNPLRVVGMTVHPLKGDHQ